MPPGDKIIVPIFLALCSVRGSPYCSQNYAGILDSGLLMAEREAEKCELLTISGKHAEEVPDRQSKGSWPSSGNQQPSYVVY